MKNKLLASFLFLLVLLATGGILLYTRLRFVSYTPGSCPESAEELRNPYIGWYQIYAYNLTDASDFDPARILEEAPGPGLALLEFNLMDYRDRPVSKEGLTLLDSILKNWRSLGRQLIIRFLYDWDGNALETEPDSLAQILEHMSQTAEIINRYSDSVYILQGIFTGSWGEMHGSKYTGKEDAALLARHLASVTDESIFLSVRTPDQWRTILETANPLEPDQAHSGSLAARLGLFNDGMLGSDSDLGTYADAGQAVSEDSFGKRSRQAELAFQNKLCTYVPNGGETVIDNPLNDFPQAAADLAAAHVSYLNNCYDESVLSKWKNSIWNGPQPYCGMSGYDYISRHLGYRYVVRSSECSLPLPWEKETTLFLTLENTGFSNSYRAFDVSLVLKHTFSDKTYQLPVLTDTRFWNAGEETTLAILLKIHDYADGDYQLYLKITDPSSGCRIYLGNEGSQDKHGYPLGSLHIGRFPQ